jgi:putative DNA primase/helicase
MSGLDLDAVQRTDLGNAKLFAAEHGERFRYVVPRRLWLAWDGSRWRPDADEAAMRAAKATAETMLRSAAATEDTEQRRADVRHALASQAEPALRRMLVLASSEEGIATIPERLDAHPYLLTVANGTLDLRTGALRAHDPADLISLGSEIAYDPDAACPRWERFLDEVFDGDAELVAFIQRSIGYSLTGDTSERVLLVCHGGGKNGKTTLLEVIKALLGGLAETAAFDTFARVRADRGPRNDLARLHRARVVTAAESGEGRRLDEATVKQLTGGDTIAARFLHQEFFAFRPAFKIWLATNHRPKVDGGDDAVWDRIRLIPFNVNFRGREDRALAAALDAELPGILAWAVRGCLDWQRDGLGEAPAVSAATSEYRAEEDVLGAFLADRCVLDASASTNPDELRAAYEAYCHELGEKPATAVALGKRLAQRAIHRSVRRPRWYEGVGLLAGRLAGLDGDVGKSLHVRAYGGVTTSPIQSGQPSTEAQLSLLDTLPGPRPTPRPRPPQEAT